MEGSPQRNPDAAKRCCHENRLSAAGAFLRRLFREEHGPTTVEYAVMLALITAACVTSVQALSMETAASFDRSSDSISNAISG